MSKYIQTIPLSRVRRLAILTGGGRSLAAVKGDADLILNGGFYHMSSGQPTGHLKAEGKVLATESWNCFGFCWDKGSDLRMDTVPNSGSANYISGTELLTPALTADSPLKYPAELGGKRGRTALALAGDRLILYCSGDGTADAAAPEGVRDELVSLGADRAILLDGGGSSQCDFQGRTIVSSRRVHNYIALWLTEETPLPGEYTVTPSSGLCIRRGPGTGYARLGVYPQGTRLSLLETGKGWGRTDKGWVCLTYLAPCPRTEAAAPDGDARDTELARTLFPDCQPEDLLTCRQAARALHTLGLI